MTTKYSAISDKMITEKNVTFYHDPGHGWLAVRFRDIVELGIEEKITPFSFMLKGRAYHEEDLDMGIFLDAVEEQQGEPLDFKKIEQVYLNYMHRGYPSIDAKYMRQCAEIERESCTK